MFTLNEINRITLESDFIRYSPSEIIKVNTASSQIFNNLPRGVSVNSLLGSRLGVFLDLLHAATKNRYADGDKIRLDNLSSFV